MENLRVYMPLVGGMVLPLDRETGRQQIQALVLNGFPAEPRYLVIEADDQFGRTVRIYIPNDESTTAKVTIGE
jgi:hypothetical protein